MNQKRHPIKLLVVVWVVVALFSVVPAMLADADGIMVVEVVARDGDFVRNVRVASYRGGQRIGIGRETKPGVYELPIPEAGEFDIVCSSPGWQAAWVTKLFGGEGQRLRKTLLREGETDAVARIASEAAERFILTLPREEQDFLLPEGIRFRP